MLLASDAVGALVWLIPLAAGAGASALAAIRGLDAGHRALMGLTTAVVAAVVAFPLAIGIALFGGYAVEALIS